MGVSFHDLVIENLDTKSISIRIHAAKISLSCAISWDKREKKSIIYCFSLSDECIVGAELSFALCLWAF